MPANASWRRFFVAFPLLVAIALTLTLVSPAAKAGAVMSAQNQKAPSHEHKLSMRERRIHYGLKVALRQLGDPYVYGAEGPNAFDCSGLTMYSFGKAGIYLPRTAASQYSYVHHIAKRSLRRGDLMFFHSGSSVYHVAIFLGRSHHRTWLLQAPHTGEVVQRAPVWTSSWYAGTLRHLH